MLRAWTREQPHGGGREWWVPVIHCHGDEAEGERTSGREPSHTGPGRRSLCQENKCALCMLALNLDTQAKTGPDTTFCRLLVLPTK